MAFWTLDPFTLFDADNRFDVFPNVENTEAENLNCLSRLVVWSALGLLLYTANAYALLFALAFLAVIAGVFEFSVREKLEIPFAEPTLQNPYMNPLYGEAPHAEAPKWSDPAFKEVFDRATAYASYNVYRDQGDLYNKNDPNRSFYTIASTTTPYDEDLSFRKFLQLTPNKESCKQDPRTCEVFNDLRFKAPVAPNQPVPSTPAPAAPAAPSKWW